MTQVLHRLGGRRLLALGAAAALTAIISSAAAGSNGNGSGNDRLARINHIVVIYQENHSFDNLYGGWEGVNGLAAAPTARTAQVDQRGRRFDCLMQVDTTLAATTTGAACTDPGGFTSRFTNDPFTVDDYIAPDL